MTSVVVGGSRGFRPFKIPLRVSQQLLVTAVVERLYADDAGFHGVAAFADEPQEIELCVGGAHDQNAIGALELAFDLAEEIFCIAADMPTGNVAARRLRGKALNLRGRRLRYASFVFLDVHEARNRVVNPDNDSLRFVFHGPNQVHEACPSA